MSSFASPASYLSQAQSGIFGADAKSCFPPRRREKEGYVLVKGVVCAVLVVKYTRISNATTRHGENICLKRTSDVHVIRSQSQCWEIQS